MRASARLSSVRHGIVFVADPQPPRFEANLVCLERLEDELRSVDRDIGDIPIVFQLNKRDLPDALPVDELRRLLATPRCAYVESVATAGRGVREALDRLVTLIGR